MKRLLVVLLSIAFGVLFVSSAMAFNTTYTPGLGINGSVHDMTQVANFAPNDYSANPADTVPANGLERICIFCHAPHNTYRLAGTGIGSGPEAPSGYDYLPLWNHSLPAAMPVYQMYTNGSAAPTSGWKAAQSIALVTAPGGVSLLCLSCHDGSIAVNNYGNVDQPAASRSNNANVLGGIGNAYQIGKDNYLGNHHPIGFDYAAVQGADGEIRDAGTFNMRAGRPIADFLFGGKMECATCHSVHNTGNVGESLLWRSDGGSQLCLTCHDKGTYTAAP